MNTLIVLDAKGCPVDFFTCDAQGLREAKRLASEEKGRVVQKVLLSLER